MHGLFPPIILRIYLQGFVRISDFPVPCQVIRPGGPRMRFLYVGSGFCLRPLSAMTLAGTALPSTSGSLLRARRGLSPPRIHKVVCRWSPRTPTMCAGHTRSPSLFREGLVCFVVIGFLSTSFRVYLQLLFSLSATMTAMMAIRTTRMTRRMVVMVHWDSSSGVGGTGSGWISVPLML